MRFFLLTVLTQLSWVRAAWAQADTPLRGWTNQSTQAVVYGVAPIALVLLAIAAWRAWFALEASPANRPTSLMAYGKKPLAWAALVLVAGLGFTAYLVQSTQQKIHTEEWARFQREVGRVEADIQAQFESLLPALRGVRGMAVITTSVSPTELRDWVASRDVEQEYPGISGFGLVERFQTHGATEQYIVQSIEPAEVNRSMLRVDLANNPVARVAMDRAMQSGRPALSAGMILERDGEKRAETLYFLPIYGSVKVPPTAAQRVQTLWGWAFSPVVLGDLLAHTVGMSQGQVEFELFEGTETHSRRMLFDSATPLQQILPGAEHAAHGSALFADERPMLVSGQFFQLRVHTTGDFERSIDQDTPLRLALAGSTLAVFASITIWLLLVGRARAERLAQGMSQELQRLAMVAQRTSNSVVITDIHRRITWVNDGFTRITGYSFEEALGKHPRELLHSEKTSPQTVLSIREDLGLQQSSKHVISNRHKDGHDYWLDIEIQPLLGPAGQLIGYMAIESDVTNMVQAQETLIQAKIRADNILIGTNVGTWEWNALTQQYVVNERFSAMLGFEHGEIAQDPFKFWASQAHPDDLVRAGLKMKELLRGESSMYACDLRVRCKDESWIWVLSRGRVMTRTADGRAEWVGGIHTDITADKRNEEKLRDAESFLERSGRVAGYGAWQIDLKTSEVSWNAQTCDIHGVDHGYKPTLEQALAYYTPEARKQVQAAIKNAVECMQCWDLTLPFVDAYDNAMWVRTVGEVEFDDSGPVRLLGALQDVTRATLAQMAHAKTADMLQLVLDSAVDVAVIATDLNQSITVFNAGAERLLGYTAAEVVGQHDSTLFFDPTQLAVISESLALVLGRHPTGQEIFDDVVANAQQGEWTFVRKDGSRTIVSLSISPMRDGYGAVVGYLGLAHDISEQLEYQESLRKAKQAAEAASVAKSQFLANMSHEIRTPMNAILGMLSLLGNTPLSERQRDYTDKTEGAARSLLGLLNDLLDFSKVEAGKMELDPEPFAVNTVLGDLSVILSANRGGKNVDLVFDIDPAIPPMLVGDAMRLQQVLINLGGNALKFTAQGKVAIHWRLLGQADNQATIEIAVVDTGIGIAPENQAKIFEGFSQAEASTTRRFGGTGLGLGIAQRLVKLMGGTLTLTSALGQGSTFSFTIHLPVHQAGPNENAAANKSKPDLTIGAPLPARQPLQGMRILVVEDNPINQQVARELLAAQGAQVTLADNGRIGVDTVAGAMPPFDVVLMDLQMPVMGGLDAARAIRHDLGLHQLPVIAMTANAMESDRVECIEAGMNDHIGKPFDLTHLVAKLVHYTHWKVDAHDVAAAPPSAPPMPVASDWPQGIDVATALERMGGNAELLLRTLRAFATTTGQIADQVTHFIDAGNLASAQREMHAFKGLAATVGLNALSKLAADAELALRKQAPVHELKDVLQQLQAHLRDLAPTLDAVAERLQTMLPPPAQSAGNTQAVAPTNTAALRTQLETMHKALLDDDMGAMELHAVLLQDFETVLGDATQALDAAMADLNFELAASECEALLGRLMQ